MPWRNNDSVFATATAAQRKLLLHHSLPISPERRQRPLPFHAPIFHAAIQMYLLTRLICMVQFTSGNTATSSAVRQLGAAFSYPEPLVAVSHTRSRALWNQSLMKCKFHKSFVLIFMQNAGGVGGTLRFPTFKPFKISTFCIHLFCFDTLAHSFALFCTHAKLNPFLFNRFRTLYQKHPGVGTPSETLARGSG